MLVGLVSRRHSGSTALAVALGGGSQIASPGEIVTGLNRFGDLAPCACGAAVEDCEYWRRVRRHYTRDGLSWARLRELSRRYARIVRWPGIALGRYDIDRDELGILTRRLAAAVREASGKPHLLDATKSPARAILLLRELPDSKVIHLVRDPRGVVRSHWWRIRAGRGFNILGRHLEAAGAAAPWVALLAADWLLGNLLAEATARLAPGRVTRVRYEDLVAEPTATLRAIGRFLDADLSDVLAKQSSGEGFAPGHNLGGNEVRRLTRLRLDAAAELARPPLPAWAERVVTLVCFPLMRRYGYLGPRPAPAAEACLRAVARPASLPREEPR